MPERAGALVAVLALIALSALVVTRGGGEGDRKADGQQATVMVSLPQPPDTEAPDGAPPHWIPSEAWVMQHWLPYDEQRLLDLLHVDRAHVWRYLRDDRRTLAQLAARRGWRNPNRLARALVAPRLDEVPRRLRPELRSRALRTLTQGHLAQHVLFHSLHQDAIPPRTRDVFGVSSVDEFQRLRRADVSPLQIARMNGRSRSEVQARASALLADQARAGVRGGHMSADQAEVLLRRQRRQLPRWLAEAHYNGPPRTDRTGRPLEPPKPNWSKPAISGDGRQIVMEAYEPKLKLALERGEISVAGWSTSGRTRPVSHATSASGPGPWSAYNPSISADGQRVAFETSAGNQNFAKRYGDTSVLVFDRRSRRMHKVSRDVGTAYAPTLSADGSVVAFQAARDTAGHRTRVFAAKVAGAPGRPVPRPPAIAGVHAEADAYEPSLSGDGRYVAYTAIARTPTGRSSQVFVYDRLSGRTSLASRADGRRGGAADGEAWHPRLTADGRSVIFASSAGNLSGGTPRPGDARIYLRDLRAGTTRLVSADDHGTPLPGFASEPSPSRDGSVVAFSLAPPDALATASGATRPPQRILARDLRTAETAVVAGGSGSYAAMPSTSADGRRVAFVSDGGIHADGQLQVYMRDRHTAKTRLARTPTSVPLENGPSDHSGARRLCRLAPPAW